MKGVLTGRNRIRKATVADLPLIQDIAKRTIDQCYRPFVGNESVDWYIDSGESDRELQKSIGNCDVLTRDGNVVAFTIYFVDLIHVLMVDVSFHGMGIGSQLLAHSEKRLFGRGNRTIWVETFEGNDQAISFYVKNGWIIAQKQEDHENGVVRVRFEKRVPTPHEYGGSDIAPFLKCCLKRSWVGASRPQKKPDDVQKVIAASLSASEFFQSCDGGFAIEDGNAVAEHRCGEDALYLHDYGEAFLGFPHKTPEGDCDFEKVAALLVSRYQNGVVTRSQLNRMRPWRRLWWRLSAEQARHSWMSSFWRVKRTGQSGRAN